MTCIAGLVDGGKVWIGGDSAGSASDWSLIARSDAKVFRNGPFLIGGTNSFRMLQLLRYSFVPPPIPDDADLHRFMATSVVDAIRECLKTGGYAQKSSEQESGGTFLVGVAGHLYYIGQDYQVGETLSGYEAVGGGYEIARGALFATQGLLTPRERIQIALEAAEAHSAAVRGPFIIECLGAGGTSPTGKHKKGKGSVQQS